MSTRIRELPYVNAFGTADISSANNIDEALEIAGLNWSVKSKDLFDENGNKFPKFTANVRETDNELLGIVTDRYRIVQNSDAFSFVNELVGEGFKFDKAGQFRDGKSIWLMGSLPETDILGDKISNNIVFVNSHDGSSGVKVMMTPVRIICSNMLNLALRKADRIWATKHTTSIYSKMEEAKHTLGLADKYMTELAVEADRMANTSISDDDIVKIFDIMFPIDYNKDSERKINNISIMRNNFVECYNESDIAKYKGTVYGAVNAMSDLVSHRLPNRESTNYYENSWNRLINGNSTLDRFYKETMA